MAGASFGCDKPAAVTPEPTSRTPTVIKMATTSSTENSGLLDAILPVFEKAHGIHVDVIAVGTGKALKLGENGDVDVVLVHAPEAEQAFVDAGFGVNRRRVMANDFVILGPKADPAGLKGGRDAVEAMRRIASLKARFLSRGDDSGTHQKERALWKEAGIAPAGDWYLETGQGMGATLTAAQEKDGYCLADRGTYVAFRDKIALTVLCAGDSRLLNPYGVIAVSPARHPHVKYVESLTWIAWLTSPGGQECIGDFRAGGEVLFRPTAYEPMPR